MGARRPWSFSLTYKKGFRPREFRYNRHPPKTPSNGRWSGIFTKKRQKNKLISIEVEKDLYSVIPPA